MPAKTPLLGFVANFFDVAIFFIVAGGCVQFCCFPAQGSGFSAVGLAERKVKIVK